MKTCRLELRITQEEKAAWLAQCFPSQSLSAWIRSCCNTASYIPQDKTILPTERRRVPDSFLHRPGTAKDRKKRSAALCPNNNPRCLRIGLCTCNALE